MARIRSVHPGFFTDEDLVEVSAFARLLFIGLGTEADDKGIFEWKPSRIKMRVFPADNLDVSELLNELESVGTIKSYEIDGRKYGAIRNFRKFQKPKTPNDIHPINDDFRIFVGLKPDNSENDAAKKGQFPPKGEKPIQMEDGGGRMEEIKGESSSFHSEDSAIDPEKIKVGFNQLLETYPVEASKFKEAQKLYETAVHESIPHELIIFSAYRVRSEHFSKKPEDRKFTKRLNSWLAAQNFENDRKAWERSKQPAATKSEVYEPKPKLPDNHFLNKIAGGQA